MAMPRTESNSGILGRIIGVSVEGKAVVCIGSTAAESSSRFRAVHVKWLRIFDGADHDRPAS